VARETWVTRGCGRNIITGTGTAERAAGHARFLAERCMSEARQTRHCRHCWGKCDGYCLLDDGTCIHGWNGKHPRHFTWRAMLTRRLWVRVLWGEYGKR
jgi:hypothetical protein